MSEVTEVILNPFLSGNIERIADAIEIIAKQAQEKSNSEMLAVVHETYADHVKAILDGNHDAFTTAKAFRAMEILARQTAIQLRNK